jgi:hypothetical protein
MPADTPVTTAEGENFIMFTSDFIALLDNNTSPRGLFHESARREAFGRKGVSTDNEAS